VSRSREKCDKASLEHRSVWNHKRETRRVLSQKRPGAFGTEKDKECLEPEKTRRVWIRKRPGVSGTEKHLERSIND
jgi:hypothetical protein